MTQGRLFSIFLFALFLLVACQQQSRKELVFPEKDLSTLSQACAQQVIPNELIVKYEDGTLKWFETENVDELVEKLFHSDGASIQRIEYNKKLKLLNYNVGEISSNSLEVMNDPSQNWGINRSSINWAHQQGFFGAGSVVAVIDSRIELDHPLIQPNLFVNQAEWEGRSGVDDDGNGFVDDIWGWDFVLDVPNQPTLSADHHGTHVAGIVAQVAPQAKVLPLGFISPDGYGNLSGVLQAIRYARLMGVHIINASWGGAFCSKLLEEEIRLASDSGIFFVSASGNNGMDLDRNPQFPAAFQFPLTLTVAASRESDWLAGFSNTSFRLVHLAAPGDRIWSSMTQKRYGTLSGTSMAAPFVSGAVAIMRTVKPNVRPIELRSAILNGVDVRDYRVSSRGRLNLRRGIELLLE